MPHRNLFSPRRLPLPQWLSAVLLLCLSGCTESPVPSADISSQLITNVLLVDGTGAPAKPGSLRLDKGRIVELGEVEPIPGELILDGNGLVLAPGFIDTHSHADFELADEPSAMAAVSQGITTAVIGQDGRSPLPLLQFRFQLLENPVALNIAAFSGHNSNTQSA